MDEYNNLRSPYADSNMVKSNETRVCQIKKPEVDRSSENNSTPQPQLQRQHTTVLSMNISASTAIRTNTRILYTGRRRGYYQNQHRQAYGILTMIASGDAVQLSGAMKCEVTFKGKSATNVCHVADRDINLFELEWIDMFSVLGSKLQSVTCPQVRTKDDTIAAAFEDTLGMCTQVAARIFLKP
ncbi:unnamed protein product [Hymenolepis diminuta]|uniref:Uncharacterized protein n=1 Tax=Hymenolepis diminuta TaxID=6216 RepID=A0A564YN89_HYMDI|nr:unnamed protein product [Hymenolepis diminuta]